MKPFNIEEVRAGAQVQTRDGRPAVVHTTAGPNPRYPVIASYLHEDFWAVESYTVDGCAMLSPSDHDSDLVMTAKDKHEDRDE